MRDIADYIPVGYENAITRAQLSIRSGLSDREVRKAVKASRELICNLSDGRGYFRPAEGEERYVRAFRRQESRRSLTTTKTVKQCDAWIRKSRETESDLVKNQMSIFDFIGGNNEQPEEREGRRA